MNSKAPVEQAVILAAGLGSRIRDGKQVLPKPLVSVGGVPLLKRTILTARAAGVHRFVIVLGCQGEEVRASLEHDPDLEAVELIWVVNEDYRLKNGVSVLAAAPYVRGEFFLTMADHVVQPEIFRRLQSCPADDGVVLAVDYKLDSILDMDDATKVRVRSSGGESGDWRDGFIAEIGKTIPSYDAIDTGVFRCDPALFDALGHTLEQAGDVSLSDGIQALARRGKARVADIGTAWWQDVDNLEMRGHAEDLLFASLTKPLDGPISRNVNRRFSKWITRRVMNLPVEPNHMTVVGLLVGLASAVVTAMATANSVWLLVMGGILYQLSSMIDGCDGEIARLKFKHSDWGEWFDTVSDDVINLSYQLSLGYALFNITGNTLWLQLSVITFVLGSFVALALYRKLLAEGKGTHLAVEWSFKSAAKPGVFGRMCERFEFVAHRDFYALVLMFMAIFGLLKIACVLSFVMVSLVFSQWWATAASDAAARRARQAPERGTEQPAR